MNKLVPTVGAVIVAVAGCTLTALHLRAKRGYEKARSGVADHVLTAVAMDAETEALLSEIRTHWTERTSEIGGPHATALNTIGLEPSVSNLVQVLTYRMPEYSAFAVRQNLEATQIGVVQSLLLPTSIDKRVHVSADDSLALIRVAPTLAYVFADEADGLREALYLRQDKDAEQSAGE